jgi:uncharacterized protein YecT (DUF1311 family)
MAAMTKFRSPTIYLFLLLSLAGVPVAAQADCPWSPSDFEDDAKVIAHARCKMDEMTQVAAQAETARKSMSTRLTELHRLLGSQDDETLQNSQSAWWKSTDACPPLSKNVDDVINHLACMERTYLDRAKFLDERLLECKSDGCQPDKL